MLNERYINLLNQEIDYLKNKEAKAEEEQKFLYDNKFEDIRGYGSSRLFPAGYEYKQLREKLEKSLNFYTALTEEGIDLEKDYQLIDNVVLSFRHQDGHLRCYFYFKNDRWLFNCYIGSHSGLNEWLNDLISSEYDLFSGSSTYCYAFGATGLKDLFRYVEDPESKYKVSRKVKAVKELISFTQGDGEFADIKKVVADMLEFRFNKMWECLPNDD